MENKLVITMVALMVAALAVPAAMALNDVDYSATVGTGQSTSVTASDGAFGNVNAGSDFEDNVKTDSITCQNVGNVDATVAAKFTTDSSGTHGLVSGTDVIGGINFKLGDSNFDLLNNGGTDVTLTDGVLKGTTVTYDAKLKVPAGQAAGAYSGTVQLTFS